MSPFEEVVTAELGWLLRARVPPHGVRLSVREIFVARLERGPLGSHEVEDAVEGAVRAACRLVREMGAPDEVIEAVCRSALDAVRGHGGESARWLVEARGAAYAVLVEFAQEQPPEPSLRRIARNLAAW
jgi:hypothetical protein